MDSKICCFTGHRSITENEILTLPDTLKKTIEALYLRGVREFRSGGAIGFDTIAALNVIDFRTSHPDVRLALILPCRDQDSRWCEFDREIYHYILEACDSVLYIENSYTVDCMHRRNRSLVNGSDFCVAYVNRDDGGSAYTLKLARKAGVEIINLAPNSEEEQLKI